MKVKICGITNVEDALLCQNLGADALGFIFYKGSKRYVEPSKVSDIIKSLSPFIMKVGVFVDDIPEEINRIATQCGLNAVQLHVEGTADYHSKINMPVIKAFRVNKDFDFSILEKLNTGYFLLDSYSKEAYGGTGKKFNWEIIPQKLKQRIILAGGISVENIDEIFCSVKPAAIDLSSSLEIEPGKKSADKVKMFFNRLNILKGNQC